MTRPGPFATTPAGWAQSEHLSRWSLLGGVGLAVLLLAMPKPALADDACTWGSDTVTCTGDVSDGILLGAPYTTLNVNNLTTDIAPVGGKTGIRFYSDGPVHVTSNTGSFKITATGTGGDGIFLQGIGEGEAVSLDHTGDVSSALGRGIWLEGDGPVSETGTGKVQSAMDAIHVYSAEAGAIVDHNGNLTSTNGYGVYAQGQGSVQVTTNGVIQSKQDGIFAYSDAESDDGTVKVDANGNITASDGSGINAVSDFHAVTVDSVGDIDAHDDGIYAYTHGDAGDASVTVHQTGDVTAGSDGVHVESDFHSASATIDGDAQISAGGTAVLVKSHGEDFDATSYLSFNGDITAAGGRGIDVQSSFHSASATVTGNVNSTGDGIYIASHGDNFDASATLNLTGNVTSSGGYGVYVESPFRSASATIVGNVQGKSDAIFVKASGDNSDSTATVNITGNVTSTNGRGVYAESAYHAAGVTVVGKVQSAGDGVYVKSDGDNSDASASANITGDVTSSGGKGIYAESAFHGASIISNGDVSAFYDGIYAKSTGSGSDGNATIDQTGDVGSSAGMGAYAHSANGQTAQVMIKNGDVDAYGDGVHVEAKGSGGTATGSVTGDVTSSHGQGMYVASANWIASGTVTGDIHSSGDGLHVESLGSKATATVTGDVTSSGGRGVYVHSATDTAMAMVNGSVQASGDGVYVKSDSSEATALVHGETVNSTNGYGIYVEAPNGKASEIGSGDVSGKLGGISVASTSDTADVLVSHTGDVSSSNGKAIWASAARGKVVVNLTGDVQGKTGGIDAETTGSSEIDINHTGDVATDAGTGVYGYSSSGAVHITQAGDVTGGDIGIAGKSESTMVNVTLSSGKISGAVDAAVSLDSINGATFANHGEVDGGSGTAIKSNDYAATYISNYGTVTGKVDIDDLAGGFTNFEGSLYNITDLEFSNGGFLSNSGTVSPGGVGTIRTANVEGNYTQSATGTMLVDIDGDQSDKLAVDGSADLDGALKVHFNSLATAGTTYTVLTSAELGTQNLALDASAITYTGDINYVNGTDVTLGITYDFAAPTVGANQNEQAVGDALNDAHNNGVTALNPLLTGLANIDTEEGYQQALAQLTPDIVADASTSTDMLNSIFAGKLFSCRVADGAYSFNAEGECVWISNAHSKIERTETAELSGFEQTSDNLSLGVQKSLGGDWRLGFGVGHTTSDATNTVGASVSGDQVEGGMVLKYDHEALSLAVALTAGVNTVDTLRPISFGGFTNILTGEGQVGYVSGRLHAAYTQQFGNMYVRPLADLDVTSLNFHDFSEAGGVAALDIADTSQLTATFTPGIEFGAEAKFIEGSVMRPFVRFGASMSTGTDMEVTSNFQVDKGDSFTTTSGTDAVLGTLDAGIDIVAKDNTTLRLFYDGAFGDTTTRQSVGLKLAAPF